MKLSQLREILNEKHFDENLDWEVVVLLDQSSFGASASSIVKYVSEGFDYDRGKIILHTEDKLVKRNDAAK